MSTTGVAVREGKTAGSRRLVSRLRHWVRRVAPVVISGPSSRHWVGAWLRPSWGVRVAFGPAVDLSPY